MNRYDYELIRSRRRTIELQLKKTGEIVVRAPYNISNTEIKSFIESKSGWIEKHLAELEQMRERGELEDLTTDNTRLVSEEMLKALTEEAQRVIPPRVAEYAERMGVTYGHITIRHQKTRWGSCSCTGNLNFNCLLMKAPTEILDYVIVHELCHRWEMNHSRAFWQHVAQYMPDYRQRRKWLRLHGRELFLSDE